MTVSGRDESGYLNAGKTDGKGSPASSRLLHARKGPVSQEYMFCDALAVIWPTNAAKSRSCLAAASI